jgi:MarR family 2-MHQ and catechol resistance regulon transcriptional repressor
MKPLSRFGIEVGEHNILEGAIYGLAGAYSLLEKTIANYLRPFKLTPAKFNAMMIIKHQGKDKGISQIEIGRKLIVTASNMTHLIDKLESEGYIDRLSQKGDRRVNLIRISKVGSELLDKVWPGYYKRISEVSNLLPKDELGRLSGLLVKWSGELESSLVSSK